MTAGASPPPPRGLVPFPGETVPTCLSVSASVSRGRDVVRAEWRISGDLPALSIPPAAAVPSRRDRLWEETCLELFLAEEGAPGYLEFNLSPSGHWNAWRFDGYREGMREEPSIAALPFRVEREAGSVAVALSLDPGRLFPPARALLAGLSAVVRTLRGDVSRWALAHPAPRPDFHRRESFLARLPAPGRDPAP